MERKGDRRARWIRKTRLVLFPGFALDNCRLDFDGRGKETPLDFNFRKFVAGLSFGPWGQRTIRKMGPKLEKVMVTLKFVRRRQKNIWPKIGSIFVNFRFKIQQKSMIDRESAPLEMKHWFKVQPCFIQSREFSDFLYLMLTLHPSLGIWERGWIFHFELGGVKCWKIDSFVGSF